MRTHLFIPRIGALFLSCALFFPHSALALRQTGLEESPEELNKLKQTLHPSTGPSTGLRAGLEEETIGKILAKPTPQARLRALLSRPSQVRVVSYGFWSSFPPEEQAMLRSLARFSDGRILLLNREGSAASPAFQAALKSPAFTERGMEVYRGKNDFSILPPDGNRLGVREIVLGSNGRFDFEELLRILSEPYLLPLDESDSPDFIFWRFYRDLRSIVTPPRSPIPAPRPSALSDQPTRRSKAKPRAGRSTGLEEERATAALEPPSTTGAVSTVMTQGKAQQVIGSFAQKWRLTELSRPWIAAVSPELVRDNPRLQGLVGQPVPIGKVWFVMVPSDPEQIGDLVLRLTDLFYRKARGAVTVQGYG